MADDWDRRQRRQGSDPRGGHGSEDDAEDRGRLDRLGEEERMAGVTVSSGGSSDSEATSDSDGRVPRDGDDRDGDDQFSGDDDEDEAADEFFLQQESEEARLLRELQDAHDSGNVDFLRHNMLRRVGDGQGEPVALLCIHLRQLGLVEAMLRAGLDRNLVASTGETMMLVAAQSNHWSRGGDLLCSEQHIGTSSELDFDPSARRGSPLQFLRLFHAYGCLWMASPDVYEDQVSILHYAARADCPSCCKQLLIWGVDVNTIAPDGCSPLVHAAYFGRIHAARVLCQYGANPFVQSNDDSWTRAHGNSLKTAIDYAREVFECDDPECYCHLQLEMMDILGREQVLHLLESQPAVPNLSQLCRLSLHSHGLLYQSPLTKQIDGLPVLLRRFLRFEMDL